MKYLIPLLISWLIVQPVGVADNYVSTLENKWGIKISRNERIVYHNQITSKRYQISLETREPSLIELETLEYALDRSVVPCKNAKLQFLFLNEVTNTRTVASWEVSSDGISTVIIQPEYGKNESVYLHELAHHIMYKTGFDTYNPFSWNCRELGWKSYRNLRTGEIGWLIITNNGTYKHNSFAHFWVKCNEHGQIVSDRGKIVERSSDSVMITTKELIEIAEVRPATMYVDNPVEVLAEGLTMFWISKEKRENLLKISPKLYAVVESYDKKSICKLFGPDWKRSEDRKLIH